MDTTVVCPEGCDSALPVVSYSKCNPKWKKSEITAIAMGKADTAAFNDFGSAAEWAARASQTNTGANAIRLHTVRGNKPASTKTTIVLTGNRTITTNRHHVINFLVDEVTDENFDFFRTTQCGGGIQMRIWYVNNDGDDLHGGNPGVLATVFAEEILDEGTGAIVKIVGTIEWDAAQDPAFTANPIAGYGTSGNSGS